MTFGGAGASLAVILLVAQIGVGKSALVWGLGIASIAFPLWLALALTYEIWLALKLDFGELWKVKWLRRTQAAVFYTSGLLTASSIGFLLFALEPKVALTFVAACIVGVALVGGAMAAAGYQLAMHFVHRQRTTVRADDA